ncbi:DUF397 domain-containing protein [Streptomyces sp. NPDC048389]|uniref:DUF397 domain-containing protein n=1 Tax=Streptomyces sp. NPDC048389 TaxID=3154622 RepID=UPI0034559780
MQKLAWHKSSYSAEGANCVCVAVAPDGTVRLRDSKVPDVLLATRPEVLGRFIRAAADGRFETS